MNRSQTGVVFDIQRFSLHDGPGIRSTVFLKGCPLRCRWCHNPESLVPQPQICLQSEREGRRIKKVGWIATPQEIMDKLDRDVLFYEESGGGVTFSGGEPLYQAEFLMALLKECRRRDWHTALDTTGYAPAERLLATAAWTDLILFDLKLMDDGTHRVYTGVSNKLILDNLQKLSKNNALITIRFPVIPEVNDNQDNLMKMVAFLSELDNVRRIQMLPYHRTGAHKYHWVQKEVQGACFKVPTKQQMAHIQEIFETAGFSVSQGDYET